MSPKLRFYCDRCGTEVPRNSARCPSCGRFFTGIQCPRCGFTGEAGDFTAGCPSCGFLQVRSAGAPAPPQRREDAPGASPRLLRIIGVALGVILLALVAVLFTL